MKKNESQVHSGTLFYQGKLRGNLGVISEHSATFGIDFVNSFSLADILAIGVGAGLRFPLNRDVISAPLYLDFRLTLSQNPVAPIIEGGWGVTFQPNSNYENTGKILIVEVGVKIKGKEKFAYMITLGYETYDIVTKKTHNYGGYSTYGNVDNETIYSGTINFGFLF